MSNQKKYEFHTVANLFPMMSKDETEGLVQDIKENGLREPIILFNDKIIDGRNRYLACLKAGVTPKFTNYKGSEDDLITFIYSLNGNRRHLSASQKACVVVQMLPEIEKTVAKKRKETISKAMKGETEKPVRNKTSVQLASELTGVNEKYIKQAKQLFNSDKDLFEKVNNGELTLTKARTILKAGTTAEAGTPIQELNEAEKEKLNYLLSIGLKESQAVKIINDDREQQIKEKRERQKRRQEVKKRLKKTGQIKYSLQLPESDKKELEKKAKKLKITAAELTRRIIHEGLTTNK